MKSRLKDTLLIACDNTNDRAELRSIFEPYYNLLYAENLEQAALLLDQNNACVAALLVDVENIDEVGVRAVNDAAQWGTDNEIPILSLIHADNNGKREELAFTRGASDVVIKPYTPASIRRRVQVLVDLHLNKWQLQTLVDEQNKTIRNSNQVMLDALSAIIEHRSSESGNHVLRIRSYTKVLLEAVAQNFHEYDLNDVSIDIIAGAAALHDIGKISIPDAILNKPGRLTDDEYEIIKTHTTVGADLIRNLDGMGSSEYLRYAYNIALYHHERWDGKGYPLGLREDEIPICAQVVGVADVYDALTTPRVYKHAYPCEQAVNMIVNGECGAFSPALMECFKSVRSEFAELAHRYADGYSPKEDDITIPLPGPNKKSSKLNASQLSLVKYQTLLHYTNDTVLEIDMDSGMFHMVYNPNPDLDVIMPDSSEFSVDMLRHIKIHPDDCEAADGIRRFLAGDYRQRDIRRKSFSFRMFSPSAGDYVRYTLTFMRVNTGDADQHNGIAIWHRDQLPEPKGSDISPMRLTSTPALQGLGSAVLRCKIDDPLTIDFVSSEFLLLTGFTGDDIAQLFGNSLTSMIEPEDRAAFESVLRKQQVVGGIAQTEFRLQRKDTSPVWALAKSRIFAESDGNEYYYFAIYNNNYSKTAMLEMKASLDRYQMIIEMSGSIIFEWDLVSDTMLCSPQWEKHFGYVPVSKNYGTQMGIATHFHPDDLPAIRGTIEVLKTQKGTIAIDVRIANSEAKYLWTKIVATAYVDENGSLQRIVGLLRDIDAVKRAEITLKEQAEHDSLTQLLNKASAQHLIKNYLAKRDPNHLAAMMILDLDNFKSVNDNYGHLYGDTILTTVAEELKKMFRAHDITARIGGDEFLILMRDIPDVALIHSRCSQMLDTIRRQLSVLVPDLDVSFSAGISLIPEHGTAYTDLFLRADQALYLSKANGKNTYTIYDPKKKHNSGLQESTCTATIIDSDEQPGIAGASFVNYIFRSLHDSIDVLSDIDIILRYVGEQLQVSRVYIFENNDDNTTCSNTFEWCNEGITCEMENLQNVSYAEDISGWDELFNEQGIFYCSNIAKLEPRFRAILEPQNIKSMLHCAFFDKGIFRGYIGFDDCKTNRMWTQSQIDMLKFMTDVISLFLMQKRTEDKFANG